MHVNVPDVILVHRDSKKDGSPPMFSSETRTPGTATTATPPWFVDDEEYDVSSDDRGLALSTTWKPPVRRYRPTADGYKLNHCHAMSRQDT